MSEFARAPALAFWVEGPGRGAIREAVLPAVLPGNVQVDTLYSAVSRGTESLVWSGRVPESEHARMRCPHQEGDFPFPVKYGYSNVGVVSAGVEALLGRQVFCLYPHQTSYVVPAGAVVLLPPGVPPERAVLAANMETALNALWDARPLLGDRISVVGGGVLGMLCAYLAAKIGSAEVELVDVRKDRADVARALNFGFSLPEQAQRERDIVFHTSATAAGLETALGLLTEEGSVIELSWYGDARVDVALGGRFHSRRLGLKSSQVGRVSPQARPRFQYRQRLELALSLCADPALLALISSECSFQELPSLLPKLADPSSGVLCQRVRYGD